MVYTEKKEGKEGYDKERKMRRNIRIKEFHTPCAGHRPGTVDPTRSKAAYPPPRWVFGYWLIDCGQKVLIFSGQGTEKIDFGAPGTENINFWCSRENIDI